MWHWECGHSLPVMRCSPAEGEALQALTVLKVRKAIAGLQQHCVQFVIFHSTWFFTRFYHRTTIIMAKHKKKNQV